MDTKKLLGKRLKEIIKQKNLTQEKLAELVEIEPGALSNIITGRNFPLFKTLEKMIRILDVKYSDIFNFEHNETPENLKEEIITILNNNPEKIKDFYKIVKALID